MMAATIAGRTLAVDLGRETRHFAVDGPMQEFH